MADTEYDLSVVTRDELLAAIREQTALARNQVPHAAAQTLRELAEAWATLTADPLPLLPSPADGSTVGEYRLSTRR